MALKKVVIDLTDGEFLFIAKMAHKKNITFNAMCIKILEEELNKLEKRNKKGLSSSGRTLPCHGKNGSSILPKPAKINLRRDKWKSSKE